MSTTTQPRTIDYAAAKSIANSRLTIKRDNVGQQVKAFIQGNATFQTADEQAAADKAAGKPAAAQYFDKYIYNLKANSQEAVSRRENKMLLFAAQAEESAGNMEVAQQLYNRWLNSIQVSFNMIARPGMKKLDDGDQITCVVEEAVTKTGHTALTVNQVKYKAPENLSKVTYSEADLVDDFTPEEIAALKLSLTSAGKLKVA